METFEFLNIAQVYGLPRMMGVLTHIDLYKKMNKQLNKRKTQLKHRFWTEIYQVKNFSRLIPFIEELFRAQNYFSCRE